MKAAAMKAAAMKARLYVSIVMLVLLALCAGPGMAQPPTNGSVVRSNGFPGTQPMQRVYYDGSGRVQYLCLGNQFATSLSHTWSVAAATLTNVVVNANVGTITFASAHGLEIGNQITISGSGVSGLNGPYYVQSIPSSSTATITTSGVANGTYTVGIVITSTAPTEIDAAWSIQFYQYGTNGVIVTSAAKGNAGNYTSICANHAVTTGPTAVYYW